MIRLNRKQRLALRKFKAILLKISPIILLIALISVIFYTMFIRYVYERDTKDLLLDAGKMVQHQGEIVDYGLEDKIIQIFKQWALDIVGDNSEVVTPEMHSYYKGYNFAKDRIRAKINSITGKFA